MLLVGFALAHPVGGHRVDHTLDWDVGPTGSEITYTIDLPHDLELPAPRLARGLVLVRDGETVPLELIDSRSRRIDDATRSTLHLRGEHEPGSLQLADGNLPAADARIRRRVRVHRDLDVLLAPPPAAPETYAARVIRLQVGTTDVLQRLERRLRSPSWRPPEAPTPSLLAVPAAFSTLLLGGVVLLVLARRQSS